LSIRFSKNVAAVFEELEKRGVVVRTLNLKSLQNKYLIYLFFSKV
jgi:hypothetical protein